MKMHKEAKLHVITPESNPDPITQTPGAHPFGTGLGAAVGGAAGVGAAVVTGAIVGSVVGPVGATVGIAVGAVVGGLAGKEIGEEINPTIEEAYWREIYFTRSYATSGQAYDDFGPAYQLGWESRGRYRDKQFEEIETTLERDWDKVKGKSRLLWNQAKVASRDAWDRITHRKV
jgi:hypothetical protein